MKLSARHVAPLPVTVLATCSKWAPHIAEDSPFLQYPEVSGAVMQPLPFLIATVQLMIQKFILRESSTQKSYVVVCIPVSVFYASDCPCRI